MGATLGGCYRGPARRKTLGLLAGKLSHFNRSADLCFMGITLYFLQAGTVLLAMLFAIATAPLFTGWIAQCRAWLQNRSAPPLTQPYRTLRKLFQKEAALAHDAS